MYMENVTSSEINRLLELLIFSGFFYVVRRENFLKAMRSKDQIVMMYGTGDDELYLNSFDCDFFLNNVSAEPFFVGDLQEKIQEVMENERA